MAAVSSSEMFLNTKAYAQDNTFDYSSILMFWRFSPVIGFPPGAISESRRKAGWFVKKL
jgi:hypothetical protein